MPRPLHVVGMGGMGDCCYQRPLVRHLASTRGELWLTTPYPELYADLPSVHPVEWAGLGLRCQAKNMARQPGETWTTPPTPRMDRVRLVYTLREPGESIVREMERRADTRIPPESFVFDLPEFGPSPLLRPYAVVRPVSVRREWSNTARNPDPSYVARAAAELVRQGFRVVVVGDLDDRQERLLEPMPKGAISWVRGELRTPALMALVQQAEVVVGAVGWIVPACLAYRTPAVVIGGGLGQHNHPSRLVDTRMDGTRMRFLLPEPYCMCRDPRHDCPKRIPDFLSRFRAALQEVV